MLKLDDYQADAIAKMKNGCILCGGVGSGKSRTGLAYYCQNYKHLPLYIITTARKRDSKEWEDEMVPLNIPHKVIIDSWNNIEKYYSVQGAFFMFDEQRVVGYGSWSKAFINIARHNKWILLSATPGDRWTDYTSVFIANGFYKNITEFRREHCIYSRYTKYPKIERYINTARLVKQRRDILVCMDYKNKTTLHHENIFVDYDELKYKYIVKERWNEAEKRPIKNASEYCQLLRKLVNSDESRQVAVCEIMEQHPRVIIFYNYDYELEILRNIYYGENVTVAEWNGHKHQPVPNTNKWVYLVEYAAGAEAWNCITTDTMIFFSANYSYKVMVQAAGRTDRRNTPYTDLYYYHLISHAPIDLGIVAALNKKKTFNEAGFFETKASSRA